MSASEKMEYQNRSFFFIPIQLKSYDGFMRMIEKSAAWEVIPIDEVKPAYTLPYITSIACDPDLFRSYRLREPKPESIFMYEDYLMQKQKLDAMPVLTEVRLSCFSTNIGFLEYIFSYGEDCDVARKSIMEFPYRFKRAKPTDWNVGDKLSLYDYSVSILPPDSGAELFFTGGADFKCECKCFHTLRLNKNLPDSGELNEMMQLLARNYNQSFSERQEAGSNDMKYEPYQYSHWSGSPEGLANVVLDPDNMKFINTYLYKNIMRDYRFVYLVLLNQRFSLLSYIKRVAEVSDKDKRARRKLESISAESMRFKARFSFRVISDDLMYQTIYARMYKILEIDDLMQDTIDNENQTAALLEKSSERMEAQVSNLLVVLSLLSVFSALIDASSFWDRLFTRPALSTWLSVGFVAAALIFWVVKSIHDRYKR